MNKSNFHFYIIFFILILSASIVNGQNAQRSSDENSVDDVSVKIIIQPLPDNILFPTTDSTIFMNLYRDCETKQGAFREGTFFIDTSKAFIMASFEDIPYGKYCLKIKYMKFPLSKELIFIELPSDSAFKVPLTPKTIYSVAVTAVPEQYSLYGGYLNSAKSKEAPSYSFVGESDVMSGRIEFTIVSRKKWEIKLSLSYESIDSIATIGKKFSDHSFSVHRVYTTTDKPPFDWIKVEKLEE